MTIEAKGLAKVFGATAAVQDASFTVSKGEVVGFVGANGAGKTTTINMLLGFISPSEGSVTIFDDDVTPQSAHRQHARIGYTAGDMELPKHLTGAQYLRLVANIHGKSIDKRLKELSKIFKPQLDKKISTLSRGNRQKIALIAAFVTRPELVILDEPTSGLDPIMQEAFLGLVRQEQQRGTTIFMSSHYLGEVADVCSRVILMRHGSIISDTPTSELLGQSGKQVRVVSGYGRTAAPRGAKNSHKSVDADGHTVVTFDWLEEPAKLQQWLASVKQLIDIEVTEHNLEAAFHGMYDDEETKS